MILLNSSLLKLLIGHSSPIFSETSLNNLLVAMPYYFFKISLLSCIVNRISYFNWFYRPVRSDWFEIDEVSGLSTELESIPQNCSSRAKSCLMFGDWMIGSSWQLFLKKSIKWVNTSPFLSMNIEPSSCSIRS